MTQPNRRTMRVATALIATTTLGLTGLAAVPAAQADTGPGASGRIAYERFVEYTDDEGFPYSDEDIFSANPDGTDELDLTNTARGREYEPTWSPDGTRIAFASYRAEESWPDIYLASVGQSAETYTEQAVTDTTDFL